MILISKTYYSRCPSLCNLETKNTIRCNKQYLENISFVDIAELRFTWPIGTCGRGADMKTLGAWVREDVLSGMQGWSRALLTRAMGMTVEEVKVLLMDVRKEIQEKKLYIYMPM